MPDEPRSIEVEEPVTRCPFCVEEGERSKLYIGNKVRTAMGATEYFDEDGKHVIEDPNLYRTRHWCSRGHDFGLLKKQGQPTRVELVEGREAKAFRHMTATKPDTGGDDVAA